MYRIIKIIYRAIEYQMRALIVASDYSAVHFAPRYHAFWVLGVIFCIYPLIIASLPSAPTDLSAVLYFPIHNLSTMHVALSLLGVILCIVISAHKYWPQKLRQQYLYLSWYITIMWCLPTLSIYGLINSNGESFWLVHAITALFTLAAFVNRSTFAVLTIISSCIAMILTAIQYFLYLQPLTPNQPSAIAMTIAILSYVPLYLTAIILIYKNQEQEYRMRCAFGSALAHELKTPIAQGYSGIELLADIIERSYNNTDKNLADKNICVLAMPEVDYEMLLYLKETIPGIITRGQKYAKTVILIGNGVTLQGDEGVYGIADAVSLAIEEYHLTASEAKRVNLLIENSGTFHGSLSLMVLVIHCLLRNSFKYAGRKANIQIKVYDQQVRIYDNGAGISKQALPHVFEMHYNTGGTGMGLTLCQSILNKMGAHIECQSELGQYTEFIIRVYNES